MPTSTRAHTTGAHLRGGGERRSSSSNDGRLGCDGTVSRDRGTIVGPLRPRASKPSQKGFADRGPPNYARANAAAAATYVAATWWAAFTSRTFRQRDRASPRSSWHGGQIAAKILRATAAVAERVGPSALLRAHRRRGAVGLSVPLRSTPSASLFSPLEVMLEVMVDDDDVHRSIWSTTTALFLELDGPRARL
ncbi:uncharacterized protein PSFLO_00311 [Pseudozyma flocculosa]|uniref:Uncharacterized protein n=1 Tax=Pseudozyma flocculosa TaxID=84751 RepID=A0A5C3ESL4_9BASI|nr:uncharacterized protein PSFLO_00311 [Pseudozyma flocculosa]